MSTTTVSAITSFISSLENSLKSSVSGFEGFGSDIKADVGAAIVDVETLTNGVLTAFTASGNAEAAIIAPIAAAIEGLVNGAEAIFGIGTTTTAPATVTAATGTLTPSPAPVNTTQPTTPVTPASNGDDGLGDMDADTGAL